VTPGETLRNAVGDSNVVFAEKSGLLKCKRRSLCGADLRDYRSGQSPCQGCFTILVLFSWSEKNYVQL